MILPGRRRRDSRQRHGSANRPTGMVGGRTAPVARVTAKIGGLLNLRWAKITPVGRIAIDAEDATIAAIGARGLRCEGCWYLNSTVTGGIFLDEAQIVGDHAFMQAPQMTTGNGGFYARNGFRCEGTVNLAFSTVGGPIVFDNAALISTGGKAFTGIGIRLTGDLRASPGAVFEGTVDLAGAEISGAVELSESRLTASGPEGALRLTRTVVQVA